MKDAPDIAALVDAIVAAPRGARGDLLRRASRASNVAGALADSAVAIAVAEPARAVHVTAAIVDALDATDDAEARARARRARSRALSYAARFEEALVICDDAIAIAERGGAIVEAARARLASIHALGELGRLDQALEAGHAARMLLESAGEPALAARADINLGVIHQRRDEPFEALVCFERARPALANDVLTLGHLDNNRGEALLRVNDFDRAQLAFEAALAVFRAEGASMPAAIAEGNLADLAVRQGRLGRALHWFERARRSLERAGAPAVAARLAAEQADAKTVLGAPSEAIGEFESALSRLDPLGLTIEAARARCGLGRALAACGRRAEAATALAAAAATYHDLDRAAARAQVDLARCDLALDNGQVAEARRLGARAMATLIDRPADAAHARLVLARTALLDGDLAAARAELQAVLATAERLDLAPLLADAFTLLGQLELTTGDLDAACSALERAMHQVERLRGALQAERFRSAALGDRCATHALFVRACLERAADDDAATALVALERARSRSLLDRVRLDSEGEGDDDTDDAAQLAHALAHLSALYSRLADAATNDAALRRWSAEVQRQEAAVARIEERSAAARSGHVETSQVGSAADIQGALTNDERLVSWFCDGDDLVALIVDRDSIRPQRLLGRVAIIDRALHRLRFQMARPLRPGSATGPQSARMRGDAERELAQLAAALEPVLSEASSGVRRLILAPHGPLHMVPFAALPVGGAPLVDRVETVLTPSASILATLRAQPARDGGAALIVGVADDVAPGMVPEAQRVAAALPGSIALVGAAATAHRVGARLPEAALVHVAAHGRFDPARPKASGFRLADRWFTVVDVLRTRLSAELVVLSACETGLQGVSAGDELDGLVRSYLAAGARRVLTTLWPVHDDATGAFMHSIYVDGIPTPSTSARVREAMLAVRDAHPHPAFWAPFVLSGAP